MGVEKAVRTFIYYIMDLCEDPDFREYARYGVFFFILAIYASVVGVEGTKRFIEAVAEHPDEMAYSIFMLFGMGYFILGLVSAKWDQIKQTLSDFGEKPRITDGGKVTTDGNGSPEQDNTDSMTSNGGENGPHCEQ
jgi:hypothetical protein